MGNWLLIKTVCRPWEEDSEHDLKQFFRGEAHRRMMQFVMKNPHSLCLYNETYQPDKSGKYSHEPQGMATLYASLAK